MGLRDYFRSKCQLQEQLYEAQRDAEVNALSLKSEQEKNEQFFDDLMTAQHCLEEVKQDVAALENKNQMLRTTLHTVQPKLQTMKEMKWFYHAVAPALDPEGFRLYQEAKSITGVDVYSFYPYEDTCGLFAEMRGQRMLRYLEAAYFDAVEWRIIPGTTYEEGILLHVDTTTKEYQAYEKQLYAGTLKNLGFDVSMPTRVQEQSKINQEKRGEER